ncbi:hypothetical protein CYLTODRAFT_374153 [Cylindrobasidium torrendii FP15055 ss-10]|uniref:DNA polymerase V n=1 Tax=Cylindrobasidium torrendii FP15055 ss-10 TaxID=1314674 RepID=A0A0D7BDP2_9AGAR|nr:hypothetical protein CYLTODRAFT_374153 [Cylindrobasidium torrendii FP15055 ss-10]
MSTTLPLFWNLSSANKKERIDSSVKLVSALEQFQAQITPGSEDSEEDEEDEAVDPLDKYNAQDVSYSIRRLIRGLPSPRESSRLGFSVALTELLSKIRTVTCSQIFELLVESTKTQKSMSGQEERDMLFGRLFGITSIVQSGLLVRTDPLTQSPSASTDASSLASFKLVVDELQAIGEKKNWLRESVAWTLVQVLDALQTSSVSWKKDAFVYVLEVVYQKDSHWTPEKIALALKIQRLQPDLDLGEYTAPTFSTPNLLQTSNLHTLATILKDTEENESGGTWKPDLHFVWNIVLDALLPSEVSSMSQGNFADFFRIVVDESLFAATSSPQRKYWGFQIFQRALPRLADDVLPMVFTKNFMRTWINHLSKQDRNLHKAAKQTAVELSALVKERPQIGMGVIVQLVGANGSQQFDKLTHTKTVESILASMTSAGIVDYVEHLIEQFNGGENVDNSDVEVVNARRTWVIDQFAALIRNGSVPKEDKWVQSILEWLVVNGLFIVRKPIKKGGARGTQSIVKPPLSDALRESCRSRLLACLADLSTQTTTLKTEEKTTRAVGVASDAEFWICKTVEIIEKLQNDTKHTTPLVEVEEDGVEVQKKMRELDTQLRSSSQDENGKEAAQGCRLLMSGLLVAEYCGEQEEWDLENLEACTTFAAHFVPKPKAKKSKKKDKAVVAEEEEGPAPIDGLVDLIIGLLEKSSSYMRSLGNNVFALLSGCVTESSIELILTQLERRDPTKAEDSDDEMDVDEEGGEDDNGAVDEDEEDSESEADEEDDGEESDVDGDVDEELKNKIMEALKMNGADGESDEEDEIMMDDDQMLALDEQLAAAFRSQVQGRKSGKDVDAQREATHFKNRVLDLVDLFVKKHPTSALNISLILPLVALITSSGSDEKQLIDKAQGILRNRIGKSKDVPSIKSQELPEGADADKVYEVLEAVHARARKGRSEVSNTLSICSLYLTKVLASGADDAASKAVALYVDSLKDFLTRKNSVLQPGFFQEFANKFPKLAWELRGEVLKLSGEAVNGYRQLQALRIVQTLLNHLHGLEKPEKEVLAFMSSLRATLLAVVEKECGPDGSLTVAQIKDVLKLALSGARQTLRVVDTSTEKVEKAWSPKKWEDLAGKLAAKGAALPNLCKQIAQVGVGKKKGGDEKAGKAEKGDSKKTKSKKVVAEEENVVVEKEKSKTKKRKGAEVEETVVEPTEEKRKKKKVKA